MLQIPARTVYVDKAVYRQPNCRERLERVLPHVQCDDVRDYDDAAREHVWGIGKRRHGKDEFGDETVVVFTPWEPDRSHWYFHWRNEEGLHGGVCQPALELNVVDGCVFRCAYCGFGRLVHFSLDLERLMEEMEPVLRRYPDQRLYKFSNMTDLPPFEPELDFIPPMVRRFASETDRYLMLFTKSDNVDFLLDLDHGGQTIVSWSVTCDSASRLVDRRAATMHERVAAMRKAQQAGYLVRARLSPIVPVKNWREEYTQLFATLFEHARPDLVTLELIGWMDFEDLDAIIDRAMLDPGMLAEAEQALDMRGVHWGPFTQRAHTEVYEFCVETVRRLSPGTPVSVCHGTEATWAAVGDRTDMRADAYICNCGPMSAPGDKVYDRLHRRSVG